MSCKRSRRVTLEISQETNIILRNKGIPTWINSSMLLPKTDSGRMSPMHNHTSVVFAELIVVTEEICRLIFGFSFIFKLDKWCERIQRILTKTEIVRKWCRCFLSDGMVESLRFACGRVWPCRRCLEREVTSSISRTGRPATSSWVSFFHGK